MLVKPKAKYSEGSLCHIKCKQNNNNNNNKPTKKHSGKQKCCNLTCEDNHVSENDNVWHLDKWYFLCCYFAMLQGSWECYFKLFHFSGWTKICHIVMGQNHSDLGHCYRNVQVITGPSWWLLVHHGDYWPIKVITGPSWWLLAHHGGK